MSVSGRGENKMPMLKMEPACKDYLWGGERLREKYHIRADCHPLAEA